MGIYDSNRQVRLNVVDGSTRTGLYSTDGAWNIVLTSSTTKLYSSHPCGALYATITTDPYAGYYASNNTMNVILNTAGTGYTTVWSFRGTGGSVAPVVPVAPVSLSVAPAAFYGTYRLSSYSAASPCLQVVRSSDSATQDIGFVNGQLDMASALTFAGGSNLTVSKWYDQSGNSLDAVASTNRPTLSSLNIINGIQAICFDGSNGVPILTRQMTLPAGLALDVANVSQIVVGRQSSSGGNSSTMTYLDTAVNDGDFRVFQGLSYLCNNTQTNGIYIPTNPSSVGLSRGPNSGSGVGGANGQNYLYSERQNYRTGASANTGTGTSAGGFIGNTLAGASRLFAEIVAVVFFPTENNNTDMQAAQLALEAPFPTPIQRVFTDTVTLEGDSICLGTGTTFGQNSTRQIWPLLKRPTRMINAGIFGATMNSLITTGSAHYTLFGGWTQTTKVYVLESCVNDFAATTTVQGLSNKPTIAVGGTGYAVSSTFNVTTAGGTGTQAIVSVTTNGSGVVTTVNSISNMGAWTVLPTSPNTPTGGTGVGLTLNLTFAVVNTFAFVKNVAIQMVANAKAGGQTKVGLVTALPRSAWIGPTQNWIEAQAYSADLRANPLDYGYDFLVDVAADSIMGDITQCSNTAYYADGTHPNNGGWARMAPIYATAINTQLP